MKKSKLRVMLEKIIFTAYNKKKRRSYQKTNPSLRGKNTIVFFGDSITDYCDLNTYYPEYNAVNRGIAGNTTCDLLNRMDISVFALAPAAVVLLIGINDMMNEGKKPDEVVINYEKIIQGIKENCPNAKIICQSVYPGWNGDKKKAPHGLTFPIAYLSEDIVTLNVMIQKLCQKYGCIYADIHTHLKCNDNTMKSEYSDDGCHPNSAGYKIIAEHIKKYL